MSNEVNEIKKGLSQIVKTAEEIVQVIDNADLKKIAFNNVLQFLLDVFRSSTLVRPVHEATITKVRGALSLSEFINIINPKSHPERIVAIAYYMKKYEEIEEFDKKTLIEKFREAALPLPANIGRDIKVAIRKGWLSRRRQGRTYVYYITIEGIKFIEGKIETREEM